MDEVRLDPQQIPARAELLLAAELGEDAPGQPIYAGPEPDGHDDGECQATSGIDPPATSKTDPRRNGVWLFRRICGQNWGSPERGVGGLRPVGGATG